MSNKTYGTYDVTIKKGNKTFFANVFGTDSNKQELISRVLKTNNQSAKLEDSYSCQIIKIKLVKEIKMTFAQ